MVQAKLLKVRDELIFCGKIVLQKIKDFNFKKRSKFFLVFVFLIFFGLILPQGFARGADMISFILDRSIFPLLFAIFAILLQVAALIAWIAAYVLNSTLDPLIINQVFANPAIYRGWEIIRDICNLLFLLLLLLVAFGTILQSNKYNIKNSLPRLIITIFLINFSYPIAGVIIDFGNILMYGILKMTCMSAATCFQDYFNGLMGVVDSFKNQYSLLKLVSLSGVNSTQVIGAAIATIYTFIYAFILLALALFLMVRVAGLAMLLILAPFAYFGEVMPGMEKVASKWWNSIWSYSLFGPIFALMLYISSELAKITITVPPITDPSLGWYSGTIIIIISNVLPLFFLLSIIPITKELGLAGTNTIIKNTTGLGEKIGVDAVKYFGNAADRFAARGAVDTRQGIRGTFRRGLSNLSPGAWKRAVRNMKAEQDHDFDIAAGSHWNKLEKLPGGNKTVDRKQIAIDREVTRVMSTLSDNIAALAATNQKAKQDKDAILIEASLKKLSTTGDTSVALRQDDKEESRYGFNDYMQDVQKIIGKERAEVLAEEVGYAEDKDGNSGFMGFRKTYENGTSRLRNIRDNETYWDDIGNRKTRQEYDALSDKEKEKFKTDAQWQQESINEKLSGKSPYPRNNKLKAVTFFRQVDALDAKGDKIIITDPLTGKEKVKKKNVLDETGVEYYNTIGKGNLEHVKRGIKKEMVKQRDALYQYAIKHEADKWHTVENGLAERGLTDMELAHLLELEQEVGEDADNRPKNIPRKMPKDLEKNKKTKEKEKEEKEFEEEGVYEHFATSNTGKGRIGVNRMGEVEMDEIARKNINEVISLDEETKRQALEGYRQVMLHEDEHIKPSVKSLKNPRAREVMAEAGKLAGDNYNGIIDYIDKQAAAHVLADFAERGIEEMKNVKYGLGVNELKPSDTHFVGIKPEVREEVIKEMEKVRQDWVNKYNEKLKNDAEKMDNSKFI